MSAHQNLDDISYLGKTYDSNSSPLIIHII